ncbi:Glycoside hydrolase, family 19, catalytic [Corchorus capsularis]|uniref:Glycoside hydrolase, family 19, catalytic n=1 Tax=Corchorus capsularis TaxID=210143 RepID=A0A1R3GC97_COCAP|nr:Glycoside hydrolase, family 19, catalytic [Corchorus capsularis]
MDGVAPHSITAELAARASVVAAADNSAETKQEVLYVQMGYAGANIVIVAPHPITAELAARVSLLVAQPLVVVALIGFGTTGDLTTRKRELAAFLTQTSHETTGGWPSAPDGPYAWGYCFINKQGNPGDYCVASQQWPCASGKKYFGRGPIQISYTKPSCHDVITGQWTPSAADTAAGRLPGYGVITNIINGGIECGKGSNAQSLDRIGFYKRYCDILQVSYGNNLDCDNQSPFA